MYVTTALISPSLAVVPPFGEWIVTTRIIGAGVSFRGASGYYSIRAVSRGSSRASATAVGEEIRIALQIEVVWQE